MKKDFQIPSAEGICVAIVADKDADGKKIWSVGLFNERPEAVFNVIINASGSGFIKGKEKQTAKVRFLMDELQPGEFKPFEILVRDSIELTNTYWITFFSGNDLCDKKIQVPPKYVMLQKRARIGHTNKVGVVAR